MHDETRFYALKKKKTQKKEKKNLFNRRAAPLTSCGAKSGTPVILLSQVLRSILKYQNFARESLYSCFAISPLGGWESSLKQLKKIPAVTWQVQFWKQGNSQSDCRPALVSTPIYITSGVNEVPGRNGP